MGVKKVQKQGRDENTEGYCYGTRTFTMNTKVWLN